MKLSEVKKTVSEASEAVHAARAHLRAMEEARGACVNFWSLGGHEVNVVQATEALYAKNAEFGKVFPLAAFSVFLEGDATKADQLANLVIQQTDAVTVNFMEMLSDVMPQIRDNSRETLQFGTYGVGLLKGQIMHWASMYYLQPAPLNFAQDMYVGNAEGTKVDDAKLYSAVCDVLTQLPVEYFKVLLQDLAIAKATSLKIDSAVVPVLFVGITPNLRNKLESTMFEGRSLAHQVSDSPSEEEAVAVLKRVKAAVNKTEKQEKTNNE